MTDMLSQTLSLNTYVKDIAVIYVTNQRISFKNYLIDHPKDTEKLEEKGKCQHLPFINWL